MGYCEQIGEANREFRRRRAAMHPPRRRLGDAFSCVVTHGAGTALWIVLLASLRLPALQ